MEVTIGHLIIYDLELQHPKIYPENDVDPKEPTFHYTSHELKVKAILQI